MSERKYVFVCMRYYLITKNVIEITYELWSENMKNLKLRIKLWRLKNKVVEFKKSASMKLWSLKLWNSSWKSCENSSCEKVVKIQVENSSWNSSLKKKRKEQCILIVNLEIGLSGWALGLLQQIQSSIAGNGNVHTDSPRLS